LSRRESYFKGPSRILCMVIRGKLPRLGAGVQRVANTVKRLASLSRRFSRENMEGATNQGSRTVRKARRRRLVSTAAAGAAGLFFDPSAGLLAATAAWLQGARGVREATRKLMPALANEARKDQGFQTHLYDFRSLYLNRRGQFMFTNRPRVLGIGRYRLSTQEILGKAGLPLTRPDRRGR